MRLFRRIGGIAASGWMLAAAATAQQTPEPKIEVQTVRDNISMLIGQGGNIGVSTGADGVIVIDDQYAMMTDKIMDEVKKLSDKPVRFLINTHWHQDHTGGNENFGKAGVTIVAHENVRKEMSVEHVMKAFNRTIPASPPEALPVVTFDCSIAFHLNGDDVKVTHVGPAHTNGDSIIYFAKANVLHTGDVYFNGMYPYIDSSTGGSIEGVIGAIDEALKFVNDDTRVIPGHGPLSGVKEMREYQAMLKTVADRIRPMIKEKKSREDVVAAKPTADLDATWGNGFLKPDIWVGIVYDGMVTK